ncbi:MAG: HEAT repeat domain-containing protein [Myxococcales bacterium]
MGAEAVELVVVIGGALAVFVLAEASGRRRMDSEAWRELGARLFRGPLRAPRLDWRRLARELSLEHPDPELAGIRIVTGTLDGVKVALAEECDPASGAPHVVAVEARGLPEELVLRAEDRLEALKKAVAGEDVQVGDPDFDRKVSVQGPQDVVLSVLGRAGRRAALQVVERGAVVKSGTIRLELARAAKHDEVVAAVRVVAEAAASLAARPVALALEANAKADPEPEVRRRNLEVLLRAWGRHDAVGRALQSALVDPSPQVRVLAAKQVDDARALPVLLALVEDPEAPAAVRWASRATPGPSRCCRSCSSRAGRRRAARPSWRWGSSAPWRRSRGSRSGRKGSLPKWPVAPSAASREGSQGPRRVACRWRLSRTARGR